MAEFSPDETIGAYRIVRPLGKGAMGAVYEVVHEKLGVHYALKSFTLKDGHVDVLKEKFLAEGRILARLHHPNVVRVFDLDFDEATSTPYFVMDLVLYKDGIPHTLADIDTSDLDEEYIRRWFAELADALDYIHAQGIVHRDIKLGNVLLAADKHVVLSDFGVSRLFSDGLRQEVRASTTMVSEASNSRLIMGTRGYMAPEVERGEEATPAADVYSLAVMIVYLLTGVWYEPGSRALQLLETLDLPWGDVLPQMLAENPDERPTILAPLAKRLGVPVAEAETVVLKKAHAQVETRSDAKPAWKLPSGKVLAIIGGGIAASIAVFVAAWLAFGKPAAPQSAEEEFAAAVSSGKLYCVIDLSAGPTATNYPVSYLAAEPKGGWTDEYKTTKLVLRRIEPGTFIMGEDQTDESHRVTINDPFYIGVFEVTQKQYELVTGGNPSRFKGDMRPVDRVSWEMLRGSAAIYNWPKVKAVALGSFIGRIRSRTGMDCFDLPSDAQWEYACRAGATTPINSGKELTEANMAEVGHTNQNRADRKGGYPQHTTVGSYLPNAWGLYDMHGNQWEWCLDLYEPLSSGVKTDPKGPIPGVSRVIRSSSWTDSFQSARSANRHYVDRPEHFWVNHGCRLALTLLRNNPHR